jgi:hypothetical protein
MRIFEMACVVAKDGFGCYDFVGSLRYLSYCLK